MISAVMPASSSVTRSPSARALTGHVLGLLLDDEDAAGHAGFDETLGGQDAGRVLVGPDAEEERVIRGP